MPNLDVVVNSFQSGEISPLLYGRTETDFYSRSCRFLENMFVLVEGGVQKRGGSKFGTPAYKEDKLVRILPFNFSADQSYIMEFGDKYARIITRDGVLLDPKNSLKNAEFADGTANWTAGGSATFTVADGVASVSVGYIQQTFTDIEIDQFYKVGLTLDEGAATVDIIGDYSGGTDTLFTALADGETFAVDDAKYTQITFRINVTAAAKISATGCTFVNRDYIVESPYTSEQLQQVQYVQSADVVYLVHPDIRPKEFARGLDEYGNIQWAFSDYEYDDGPYQTVNGKEDRKLKASATTGKDKTITATGFSPFKPSMVGGFIRLKASAKYGYAKITGYTSPTVVNVDIIKDFDGTADTTDFYLPAWSDDLGWPAAVSLYEQRIVMGKTKTEPQGFWATYSGDFYKYTPTDETGQVTDDSAMNNTILAGTHVSLISFIVGTQNLVFGTGGGLYRTNTTNSAPLSTNTARVLYDNGTECADIQPIQIGTLVLFAQRQRKKLFSAQYDFAADALVDNNVAQFARHLIHSPIKEISLQREPYSTLWVVLDDGTLRTCTYNPSQGVVAWNRVKFGGFFRGGAPLVESVASISGYNEDNAWVVVRRTINGQERRYIERIVEEQNTGQEYSFYVDSGATIEDKHDISNIVVGEDIITVTTVEDHGLTTGDKVNFYDVIVEATQTESEVLPGESVNGQRSTVTVVDSTNFTVPRKAGVEYNNYIEGGVVRKYLTVLTGLDHLEGQYVQILADGAVRPALKVENGTVTLKRGAAITTVGLGYRAVLSPIRYEVATTAKPTLQNQLVRNVKTMVQVLNTVGMKYGTDLNNLDVKAFRSTSDKMDTAVPLRTGKLEIEPPSDYSLDEPLYLVSDQPTPFAVTSLVCELSTGGG